MHNFMTEGCTTWRAAASLTCLDTMLKCSEQHTNLVHPTHMCTRGHALMCFLQEHPNGRACYRAETLTTKEGYPRGRPVQTDLQSTIAPLVMDAHMRLCVRRNPQLHWKHCCIVPSTTSSIYMPLCTENSAVGFATHKLVDTCSSSSDTRIVWHEYYAACVGTSVYTLPVD
jgi:hypothetical protein